MKLNNFLVNFLLLQPYVACFMNVDIVNAYMRVKLLNVGFFFGCLNKQDKIEFFKQTNENNYRLKFINIFEDEIKETRGSFGVIFDTECEEVSNFLQKNKNNHIFGILFHWLILTTNSNFSLELQEVPLEINSDVHVVYKNDNDSNYTIEDVYNPGFNKGGELKIRIIGYYTKENGYEISVDPCFICSRRNMSGVLFQTQTVLPVPFDQPLMEYLEGVKDPGVNIFSRFHYHVMKSCVNYFNYSINLTNVQSWGYLIGEKLFDGVVGALQNGTVDYGSTPFFVRSDRGEVMQYGRRTWILRAAILFQDSSVKNRMDIFLKPMSIQVWIFTLLSAVIMVAFLKFGSSIERYELSINADCTWSFHIIRTIGAFCQQGISTVPSLRSGRISCLFLLLLSLLLYQFYSASLVSWLLSDPPINIKTVQDLLDSEMKVGCEDVIYNKDYFKFTKDPLSVELYTKRIVQKNVSNFLPAAEGLDLVRKGHYAFHVELATAYPIIRNSFPGEVVCHMGEVQLYRTQPMHIGYQKNSPIKNVIDTCVQGLAEKGILYRELRFWHPKKPECMHTSKTKPVTLIYLYPVLFVLGVGILLSLVFFVLELLHFRWKLRKLQNGYLYGEFLN